MKKEFPTNGNTRCPECWERLPLTDWDDPDVVIVHHLFWVHEEWYPTWAETLTLLA